MERWIHIRVWFAGLALIFASVLGGVTVSLLQTQSAQTLFTVSADSKPQVVFDDGFARVLRITTPAVVNVWSSRITRPRGPSGSLEDDPFFRRFFPDGLEQGHDLLPRARRERSLGSGVIVSANGYVLTNNHLVDGASDIKLALSDNREFSAEVVGADAPTDIAVLKIREDNLPTLSFGNSSNVQVGDIALAIGHPFGIGRTVTMGIVSAVGRGGLGIEDYEDFIQTDAAINPGSSGGALIDVNGALIGINTAILTPSGGNLGIGFAIPSNMARNVLEQIMKNGRVVRGWLGINIREHEDRGAVVSEVATDSPADRSGLRTGDLILEVNSEPIDDSRELRLMISVMSPGARLQMRVSRKGTSLDLNARLGEMPDTGRMSILPRN